MRAGVVEHCNDYGWSNDPVFGGYKKPAEWLETYWSWSLFGKSQGQAKKRYRDFVESAQDQGIEKPSNDIVSGVIGSVLTAFDIEIEEGLPVPPF